MFRYILLFILFLLSMSIHSEEMEFPLLTSSNKSYIVANVNFYSKEDVGDSYSIIENRLKNIIKVHNNNPKSANYFYHPHDGSRSNYNKLLKNNGKSIYSIVKNFDVGFILKFGEYSLIDLTYHIEKKPKLEWREDLILHNGEYYISSLFSSNASYQLFEMSYMKLINFLEKKKKFSTIFKKSSLTSKFNFYAADSKKNPLGIKIYLDKKSISVCVANCPNKKNIEKEKNIDFKIKRSIEIFFKSISESYDKTGEVHNTLLKITTDYVKNMGFRIIRWDKKKKKSVVVDVDEKAYAKYISSVKKVNIVASVENNNKLYLFSLLNIVDDEELDFSILVLDKNRDYKISLDIAGDFDQTLLYYPDILEKIREMANDLL